MKRPFMVWISFTSICCSKVAKEGKSCPRLLVLQRVAQNAKSCSKVAEHNLFMPSAYARRRRRRRRPRSCLTWRPNNRVTEPCSLSLPCTSLTLDIHAMINWHLSKQGIRWPVSCYHIAGSSVQLIEFTCFCEVDRWTSADFPIGSRAHVRFTYRAGIVL